MALRIMVAALLSRSACAGRTAITSEVPAAVLPCLRQQAPQLTSLARIAASPAVLSSVREANGLVTRAYSSDAYDSPPLGLKEALKEELDYEHENYKPPEDLPTRPPEPWTLTETPGDSQLTLTRQFGDETVEIRVLADESHDDEDDEEHPLAGASPEDMTDEEAQAELEAALDVGIMANVRVTKGGKSIDIDVRTDGSYMQVVDVSLGEPFINEDNEDTAYAGPKYDELDENVQSAFDTYLEERGIDEELGEYLLKLVEDKESREYQAWLKKLHDFL